MSVRDGLPDNAPGRPDPAHPEGNCIVLKCGDAELFMAHLKRGSIAVTVGEDVTTGQPLGNIGNSGKTLEPHLHISATKGGAETGLRFNGRKLSVNSVVISNARGDKRSLMDHSSMVIDPPVKGQWAIMNPPGHPR